MTCSSLRVSREAQVVSKSSRNSLSHCSCAEVVWFFWKQKEYFSSLYSESCLFILQFCVLLSWVTSAFIKVSPQFLTTLPLATRFKHLFKNLPRGPVTYCKEQAWFKRKAIIPATLPTAPRGPCLVKWGATETFSSVVTAERHLKPANSPGTAFLILSSLLVQVWGVYLHRNECGCPAPLFLCWVWPQPVYHEWRRIAPEETTVTGTLP